MPEGLKNSNSSVGAVLSSGNVANTTVLLEAKKQPVEIDYKQLNSRINQLKTQIDDLHNSLVQEESALKALGPNPAVKAIHDANKHSVAAPEVEAGDVLGEPTTAQAEGYFTKLWGRLGNWKFLIGAKAALTGVFLVSRFPQFRTVLANIGMTHAVASANQLSMIVAENQLAKGVSSGEIAHRTFEFAYYFQLFQKFAHVASNFAFGGKFPAITSYASGFLTSLMHKVLVAGSHYENPLEPDSYMPHKTLMPFYAHKVKPIFQGIGEKVFGLNFSNNKIKLFQFIVANGLLSSLTFLDPKVVFPALLGVRNAKTLKDKIFESIKAKIAYMSIYYPYQAISTVMYRTRCKSIGELLTKLKGSFYDVVTKKSVIPLAFMLADTSAEIVSSTVGRVIPSSIFAMKLRPFFTYFIAKWHARSAKTNFFSKEYRSKFKKLDYSVDPIKKIKPSIAVSNDDKKVAEAIKPEN